MGRDVFSQMWEGILRQGVEKRASDIHLGPESTGSCDFILNYRIGGLLQKQTIYAQSVGALLIDHLKTMSHLDIAERELPQDGRLSTTQADFRVSTLPCLGGEKAVLRILRKDHHLKLSDLNIDFEARKSIQKALQEASGLIVIAGGTGSGKTTTIRALLTELDASTLNIVTLEDPVEYRIPGISQVEISKELTFAKGLRALLRQDPDVIFVGECRDPETARLAVEAAGTGHLVLTTVHAWHAKQIVSRFMELGCGEEAVKRVFIFGAHRRC